MDLTWAGKNNEYGFTAEGTRTEMTTEHRISDSDRRAEERRKKERRISIEASETEQRTEVRRRGKRRTTTRRSA